LLVEAALARGGDERAGKLLLLHRVHVSEDHPAELGGVDRDTRIGLGRAKRGEDLSWHPADGELRADVLAHVVEARVVAWGGCEHHGLLTVGRHQCPVRPKPRNEDDRLAASKHLQERMHASRDRAVVAGSSANTALRLKQLEYTN
jgi:hypothetical protein